MLELYGVDAFLKGLDTEMKKIHIKCIETFRGFAVGAFNYVVSNTPQWSGGAAGNWNFFIGGPDYSESHELKITAEFAGDEWPGPFEVGNPVGIAVARQRNAGRDSAPLTLDSQIYVCNASSDLDDKTYIQKVEANPQGYLRDINDGGHMLARTVIKFDNLPSQEVAVLRGVKLGEWLNRGVA